ncbi:N-acetyllactosaminide 3-alpha-galactosyltransferase [Ostertagia ostertagi]
MSRLLEEQESYHDLIITDMEESYENLVFKVNAIMQFFMKFCSRSDFLMKVDDDVSIHFDRMFTYWKDARHGEDRIYCRVWSAIPAIRDPSSKWFIPHKIWPRKVFPSYCDGPIYLMGRSAVHDILNLANHCHDPFPLEV